MANPNPAVTDPVDAAPTAAAEWRSGWPLVVTCTLGVAVAGTSTYCSGLFIGPLQNEFGWSRAQASSGMVVNAFTIVLVAPLVGRLVDAIGSRRVALVGLVCFMAAFSSLALLTGTVLNWWVHWFLVACTQSLVSPIVWASAIGTRFDRSRGLAMAFVLSGTGFMAFYAPLVGNWVIGAFGWRAAYVALATIWPLATLPMVLLFFFNSTELRKRRSGQSEAAVRPDGLAPREGVRSTKLWRILPAVMLCTACSVGLTVHLIPMLKQGGLAASSAALAASLIGGASIAGRVGSGLLLDRFSGSLIGGIAFILPLFAATGLLLFDGSLPLAIVVAVLIGLCTGAEYDIAAYLLSRHMGLRNFGFFFGMVTGFAGVGIGFGPLLGGMVYDHFGDYRVGLMVVMPLALLCSLLIASLGPYDPRFAARRAH